MGTYIQEYYKRNPNAKKVIDDFNKKSASRKIREIHVEMGT